MKETGKTKRKEVLIIDDESDMRFLLKALMKRNGYRSIACSNLSTCRHKIEEGKYDILLLDIDLREENGLSLLEDEVVPAHVRVIVMSAHGEMEPKALILGASTFISKPFTGKNMMNAIEDKIAS